MLFQIIKFPISIQRRYLLNPISNAALYRTISHLTNLPLALPLHFIPPLQRQLQQTSTFSATTPQFPAAMSKIVRSLKNVANGYSSTQILVRNATSNDPSGPTTYDMEEIAAATHNSQTDFLEIMDMLDRRLNDKGKNWRHVAKSLTVLDYLVRYGSDKCVLWSKDNLYIVKTLREFVHFDDNSQDQGALIRVKAKELVALLQDDERLARERQNARNRTHGDSLSRPGPVARRRSDPYDDELQRALELSRETAEQDRTRQQRAINAEENDPELQAALKLSLEEEELRKQRFQQPEPQLLDLNDYSQQQYQPQFQQQYQQPIQFQATQHPMYYYQAQAQPVQQFDMFDTSMQPTGPYQNYGQFGQPQMQQYQQPQIPQYTGFTSSVSSPAPAEKLQPLPTGSRNPFAAQGANTAAAQPLQPSLNSLAQSQSQANAQPQFFTQPQSPPPQQQSKPQQPSRFNDTHELNNLLASGTGVDTFGNTGATRIPHQYTARGSFVASGGVDVRNNAEVKLSSNATGNPFLNTGIGNTASSAPQNPTANRMNAAPTGYGFGNGRDEPSLIDI